MLEHYLIPICIREHLKIFQYFRLIIAHTTVTLKFLGEHFGIENILLQGLATSSL